MRGSQTRRYEMKELDEMGYVWYEWLYGMGVVIWGALRLMEVL